MDTNDIFILSQLERSSTIAMPTAIHACTNIPLLIHPGIYDDGDDNEDSYIDIVH